MFTNKKGFSTTGLVVSGLVLGLIFLGVVWMSYNNREVKLRNLCKAQEDACRVVFDNTWKIIAQKAEISDQYKNAFQETFLKMTQARYGQDSQLLVKFIQEHNPTLDSSIFKEVMNAVEAQRNIFTMEQKKLIDLAREHKDLLTTRPAMYFISNTTPIEVKLVTSTKTDKAYDSGKDDDVNLYNKPSPSPAHK